MPSIEIVDKTSSIIEWNPETRIVTVEPKSKIKFRIKQDKNYLGNPKGASKASWDVFDFNKGTSFSWRGEDKSINTYENSRYQSGFTFKINKEDLSKEIIFWVEVIFQSEDNKDEVRPKQSEFLYHSHKSTALPAVIPKTVIIVKVQKPKPEIVDARWYDPAFKGFKMTEDGWNADGSLLSADAEKKIKSSSTKVKKYGEWVLLAIKTRGLIGENLNISLWDDDKSGGAYDKTSKYNAKDDVNNKNNKEGYYKGRKIGEAYEDDKLINFNYLLSKKVNKYGFVKVLIQIPVAWKQIIQDELGNDFWNVSGKVAVKIDHPSLAKTQNNTTVNYRNLYNVGDPRAPIYYGKYLLIKDQVNKEPEPMPEIPPQIAVIRDGTPMEVKKSDACKFNYIKISQGGRDKVIFSETSDGYVISNLTPFEVVAGASGNRQLVTIDLEDPTRLKETKVSLCGMYNKIKNTLGGDFHERSIWGIVDTPMGNTFETIDNTLQTEIKENKEKNAARKAKKEGKKIEKSKWTFTNKQTVQVGDSKSSIKMSHLPVYPFEIAKKTDNQLQFYAQYIYDQSDFALFGIAVNPILRYLWLSATAYNKYQISLHSCRYRRDIFIHTFPDVKWTLKLDYKGNKKSRNLLTKFKKHQHAYRPTQGWIEIGEKKLGIALGATWDKDNTLDLKKDITEGITKKLEGFGAIGEFIKKVFLGKENKESKEHAKPKVDEVVLSDVQKAENKRKENLRAQEEMRKYRNLLRRDKQAYAEAETKEEKKKLEQKIASRQKKYDDKVAHDVDKKTGKRTANSLLRNPVGIDIISPSISVEMAWSRVPITTEALPEDHHKTGMYLEGAIQVQPLIGIEAYLDFFALAQRLHPVAMAIITIADISLKLIGDGSKMVVELRATGTIGGKLQGYVNTQTGENSFANAKNEKEADGKELVQIKGDLKFSLKAQLVLKKKYTKFGVVVSGKMDAKLEATAAWEASASIGANNKGWYFQPQIQFKGLELIGALILEGKIEDEANVMVSVDMKTENEIKYQAIDPQPVTAWDKVYFMS